MANAFDPARVVFLDIEASGLGEGSFPVEVGWAYLTGGSGSLLIRPEADWPADVWDELAEDLHGLSYEQLLREGVPARDVAEALNRRLTRTPPFLVLSDAADVDSAWLDRLFEATPEARGFDLDEEAAARQKLLVGSLTMPVRSIAAPDQQQGTPWHRAQADAERLANRWRKLLKP